MKLSNKVIGLLTVMMAGLTAPVLAEDSPKTTSPAHPQVIEDWFGKEGGSYTENKGTTADLTYVNESGVRYAKITFNIITGGYAGVWQSLSPDNVVDLSKARSFKFKIKASYPCDAGMSINDANQVNYLAFFKIPSSDFKEVLVPITAFFKNPNYTPPNAIPGRPMDLSQASYVWIGHSTSGKGEFVVGPVLSSAVIPYEEKYKEALGDYRDSGGKLTLPEDARKYFEQAGAAAKKRQAFEAEGLYYQAIMLAPWYADPHYPLAVLLAENEKEVPAGIAEMKKFIELAPHSPQVASAEQAIQVWENMK